MKTKKKIGVDAILWTISKNNLFPTLYRDGQVSSAAY